MPTSRNCDQRRVPSIRNMLMRFCLALMVAAAIALAGCAARDPANPFVSPVSTGPLP